MPKNKLPLLFLFAFLLPNIAFAAAGNNFLVDYFPVYVYGDTDIYKQVFNGVAIMFNNGTVIGFVTNVVGILAFVVIVWRLVFRHSSGGGGETGSSPWELFLKQFIFLCIIMFVFLNPAFKSTVTVVDQRAFFGNQTIGGGASKVPVDNVPTVLAFVASSTSYLGYALVNLVDTAFASSKINGARYSDIGFMTNFALIDRNKVAKFPGALESNPEEAKTVTKLVRFIEKCAIPYEEITGDRLQSLVFGSTSFQGLNPAKWKYSKRIAHLEAERGVSCIEYYETIDKMMTTAVKTWETRAIRSMGLNAGSATPALKAMGESTGAAPDNVASKQTNMTGFLQYHLRGSIDSAVAAARYNDSLGITGVSAEAINQGILSASAKMADVTSQVRFLFSAKTLPSALHILIAVLYAVFPFMLVVVAIRGYPEGLKILYYYAGGMLSMELIKMSMALIHNIVSHITATNGMELLAAATNGQGVGTTSYNDIVHAQAYYQYMAEQATLAADIGTAAMFMIPMVIATGQVKLLSSVLSGATSAHAPNTTVQSANAEMAKANDAENKGADSVVAGYATAAVMKGIEENNAAIASLSKMDLYNDFNKGQVGQQMQQIGSTAGYGSELNSAQDFAAVRSGGMFQGVQSASNMKSLGQELESEQNFLNGKHSDGRALARTLGNDATAKTIGSARGLMAGDFFNERGEIDTAREGNLYKQGLENQARISANQTAGVGKLGELTRDEMNAIQYGAQAGALGQIAQGRALRSVHGTDSAGFEASYSRTAYMNAHQSLSFQKGSAQAYDAETHGGNIRTAESMGRVSNASSLRGHQQAIQMAGDEANLVASNVFQQGMQDIKKIGGFKGAASEDAAQLTGSSVVDKKTGMLNLDNKAVQGGFSRAAGMTERSLDLDANFQDNVIAAGGKMNQEFFESEAFKKEVSRLNNSDPILKNLKGQKRSAGESIANAQEGAHEWFEEVTAEIKAQEAHNAKMATANLIGKKGFDTFEALNKRDAVGVFARMGKEDLEMALGENVGNLSMTSTGGMQGSVQSGVSFSHNESRNYSYGTNISGGSAIAGAALSMGMAPSTYGAISSSVAAAGQIAGAAASVLPGGAMGKGMANLGMISHESGMAMGISAARATTSRNAASALSDGNGFMEKVASFNAGGGIGQLRADMNMAHSSYLSSIGTAGEAAAKKAWQGAQRSYNRGLATEASLARQYNALSPQARAIVDKEMGHSAFGNAGGGVTGGVNGGTGY